MIPLQDEHLAEDSDNILRCQGTTALEAWDQSITNLEHELETSILSQ